MSDPTINWCPPTTNCFLFGSATDEWIVDYRHGNSPIFYPIKMPGLGHVGNHMLNPIPTVDPYCPAFAPAVANAPQPEAIQGVQTLPPACFDAAHAAMNGVQTLPPNCFGAAAPHAFDQQLSIPGVFGCPVISTNAGACQGPSIPGFFGCPVVPSAAGGPCVFSVGCHDNHVLAQGVQTLPPHCFGAAPVPAGSPPTQITSGCPAPRAQASPDTFLTLPPRCFGAPDAAINGVQTLPPHCFAAAAQPHAFDQSVSMPGVFGCPVFASSVCHSPSMPGVFGCPVTPSVGGPCQVFSVGCHDNHAMALGVTTLPPHCFGAAPVPAGSPPTSGCPAPQVQASPMQAAATFAAVIDCGPTLGGPCHHPTQSGPACAAFHAGVPPTQISTGCPAQHVQAPPPPDPPPSSDCPQYPTIIQCVFPTSPEFGCVPTSILVDCPIPSVDICPPTTERQCDPGLQGGQQFGAHAAAAPPPNTSSCEPSTHNPWRCGVNPPMVYPLCMPGSIATKRPPPSPPPSLEGRCPSPPMQTAERGCSPTMGNRQCPTSWDCIPVQTGYYAAPAPRPTMLEGCPPTMSYRCSSPPSAFPCW